MNEQEPVNVKKHAVGRSELSAGLELVVCDECGAVAHGNLFCNTCRTVMNETIGCNLPPWPHKAERQCGAET